ncbi:MAG: glycoside hydrolase family 15 protein [Acidimicrobiia bacterium]|nr:glycoside hydrolase family 15 protein [Acidimicrobiia bacterium]
MAHAPPGYVAHVPADAPLAEYGLIGDGHTAALVGRDGSVDWWCPGRFDAPSTFGRLLDSGAGHWSIRPVTSYEVERAYVPGTLVLGATFRTATGVVRLTDALALEHGARGHEIGHRSPDVLVRLCEGLEGRVELLVELEPRPDHGRARPRLARGGPGVSFDAAGEAMLLASDVPSSGGPGPRWSVVLHAGERAGFTLGPATAPRRPASAMVEDTVDGWRSWGEAHPYGGAYDGVVRSSSLVLQGLTHAPTGAVVASPTTTLREVPGGDVGWDHRYAWMRDARSILQALWVGACPDEAQRYFRWLTATASAAGGRGGGVGGDGGGVGRGGVGAPAITGLGGARNLPARGPQGAGGRRAPASARASGDAYLREELDVPGEVLDAAWLLRDHLAPDDEEGLSFLAHLADVVSERWQQPGPRPLEGPEGERRSVSAALMSWVAVDRGCRLAPTIGREAKPERWATVRRRIHDAILEEAWDEESSAFTGAFGSVELDASLLLMPLVGFLPADHPRVVGTVRAIEERLGEGGLVRRSSGAEDGPFLACSFWLAECHARRGRADRAGEVFEAAAAHGNDLGLLADEVSLVDGALLGNFPGGLAHAAAVNAAWAIHEARTSVSDRRP